MATLLELHDLLHSDGDLWRKAEIAAIIAAVGIKYESPATANHAARVTWAEAVLADAPAWVLANRIKILENAVLQNAGHKAKDDDVQFVVNSLAPAAA